MPETDDSNDSNIDARVRARMQASVGNPQTPRAKNCLHSPRVPTSMSAPRQFTTAAESPIRKLWMPVSKKELKFIS